MSNKPVPDSIPYPENGVESIWFTGLELNIPVCLSENVGRILIYQSGGWVSRSIYGYAETLQRRIIELSEELEECRCFKSII